MTQQELLAKLHETGMMTSNNARHAASEIHWHRSHTSTESASKEAELLQLNAAIAMGKLCAEMCESPFANHHGCRQIILSLVESLEGKK